MRRDGIWHPRLAQLLAAAGHGDLIVVADPGLPVPRRVEVIDLVWARGEPPFAPVVAAIAAELVVECATAASEAPAPVLDRIQMAVGDAPLKTVTHDEFKRLVHDAYVVVRTGEATPYSNVALTGGVPF